MGARSTITALNEGTAVANACSRWFDTVLEELLSRCQWGMGFSAVSLGNPAKTLPDNATTWSSSYPAPPWKYEYAFPAAAVKINWVVPLDIYASTVLAQPGYGVNPLWTSSAAPFQLGISAADAKVINTNCPSAVAIFTKKVTDPTLWTPLFRRAFSARLAHTLAIPLSGDKALATGNFQLSERLILDAMVADANEGITIINNVPDVIKVRNGSIDDLQPPVN